MKHLLLSLSLYLSLALATAASAVSAQGAEISRSPRSVDCGALDVITLHSPQLGRDVTLDVWTPPGYGQTPGARYPVVYMHDGQNLFDASSTWNHQAWEIDSVMGRLLADGAVRPAIVVGVHSLSNTRVAELMPQAPIAMIEQTPLAPMMAQLMPTGARGDLYIDFLANDVKQLIDSAYATLPGRDDTFVMGSSMGGLSSLNALCLRPDVFGGAACLSTHLTGSAEPNEVFPTALAAFVLQHLSDAATHRLYLDTGDQTLDAAYQSYFPRFCDLACQLGYIPGTSLLTGVYPGAAHTERDWSARVAVPLTFLLAPR